MHIYIVSVYKKYLYNAHTVYIYRLQLLLFLILYNTFSYIELSILAIFNIKVLYVTLTRRIFLAVYMLKNINKY